MLPDKEMDFDPNNLPPEFLRGIGLIVANYAQLEAILEAALAGILGIDSELGVAVSTHMAAPLRLSSLRSAAEIVISDPRTLADLEAILVRIEQANKIRANAAHRSWCISPSTGDVYQISQEARAGLNVDAVPIKSADLIRDAGAIYQTSMDLMTFLLQLNLYPEIPPLGRTRDHRTKEARKERRKQATRGNNG